MSMIDAAELRRRWTDKTRAVFSRQDWLDEGEIGPESFEREFDFRDCKSIVFLNGGARAGRPSPTDVILLTKGSGHMSVPPNVRVLVTSGYARCASEDYGATDGSTVVGRGARAPPPSRVETSYARSSAGSAYNGGAGRSSYAGVSRRSSADSVDDWQVVEEMPGFRDDRDDVSVHPDDSISSVGARGRGAGSNFSRGYQYQYQY